MRLSVALDGAGWHPAAWREPRARPEELFTARYWADVITEAERGLLDFVTIEDGFSVQSTRTDQVAGRLDAVLIAARVAPVTRHIGLIPTVIVTHTEPFHAAKAIATLDYASNGRAGVRVRVSASFNLLYDACPDSRPIQIQETPSSTSSRVEYLRMALADEKT